MPRRQPSPFVWILDNDLEVSARYLPNKMLDKNIQHLIQCLVCARYYYHGIRTQAIFKFKFSNDNKEDTVLELFPLKVPKTLLGVHKFSFANYSNRVVKWCRKCQEHHAAFRKYLEYCLAEEEFRFGKIRRSHLFGNVLVEALDGFESKKIPFGNISKIIYEWKSIPVKYRKKDIVDGYRSLFLSKLTDPFGEYAMSKRNIPDFVMDKFKFD